CRGLLEANEKKWLKRLRRLQIGEWRWARGFIEAIEVTPNDLVEDRRLFAAYPLRRLGMRDLWNEDLGGLELIPADNNLTALDLTGNDIAFQTLKKLVRFRQFEGLRELGLTFNGLRDAAINFLCGEPFFQRLSLIRLGANPFTRSGRDRLRE